jgi:Flp pilus assembly pilin Flp
MNAITERILMTYAMLLGRVERPEKGASMTEYAILVAVMAGIVLILVTLLGSKISTFIAGISITT